MAKKVIRPKKAIKKEDIDEDRILSLDNIGKEWKKHLDSQQIILCEHYAVTSNVLESYSVAGYEIVNKQQATLKAKVMMKDMYIKGYINELRSFAIGDGLDSTYKQIITNLVDIANGTSRDANQDLEFPNVSDRISASNTLIKLLPDSPMLRKLEADTKLAEKNAELQEEKVNVIKSGGRGDGENQVLEALKNISAMEKFKTE